MNIDNHGSWQNDSFEGHIYDDVLAVSIGEFLKGNTAVDLGCGHGSYTLYWKSIGIECDCFDGNQYTPKLTGGLCGVMDLCEDVQTDKQYDYVVCLEVAEHIPPEHQDVLIMNLHKMARKGIILSWAIPNQGGAGHVNEQPNEYVREIFHKLGYRDNPEAENKFREATKVWWFRNTIMVFEK